MTTNASGRAALIVATGFFLCLAGPSRAAADSDAGAATPTAEAPVGAPVNLSNYTRHASHHWKKHIRHEVARKSPADNNAADAAAADADNSPAVEPATIPASVANANAQAVSGTPADNAQAPTAPPNPMVQSTAPEPPADAPPAADARIVSPDQLNDVDSSLRDSTPPVSTLAVASAEPPAAVAANAEPSVWDQTSLIGKIFIGFGALLTMGSAARMFMA